MRRLPEAVPALALFLSLGIIGWPECAHAQALPNASPADGPPENMRWRGVTDAARVRILELLSTQTKSNYERLHTWDGVYLVHREEYLSPGFVSNSFAGRLPKDSTPALIAQSDAEFTFTVEIATGFFFRETKTSRFRLLTADSERKNVVIAGVAPLDERSVVNANEFVRFAPADPPATYSVLADNPEAQNKRAARRVPLDQAKRKDHGDLIDPRLFFQCSMSGMSWDELEVYLAMLRGDRGPAKRDLAARRLRVEEATLEGRSWFRLQTPITFPGGQVSIVTSVWSQAAGFNPVSLTFRGGDTKGTVTKAIKWNWTNVDGVFVPSFVEESWWPPELDGVKSYERTVRLKSCALNGPIPQGRFTIAALGLKPGDLVRDDVEQAVFVVEAGGGTRRLASYYQPYVAPDGAGRTRKAKLLWLVAGNAMFATVVLVIVRLRRHGRSSRGP